MEHIEVISGKVEAVGQSNFDLKGSFYAYIRFLDEAGNVRMIKNVGVPNTVNSYITPGTEGKFHLAAVNKNQSILFAFDNEERKVYDSEEIQDLEKVFRKKGYIWLALTPFALFSIILFGLGLILTPVCLYFAYKDIFITPNKIKDQTLRTYLNQYGYA